MDKTFATALLIVISMVMAVMLFNVAYPALVQGGEAITNMASRAEDQMRTDFAIIHAAAEVYGINQWNDTNSSGTVDAFVWLKNVGSRRVIGLRNMEIFFGREGAFDRIPYGSNPYGAYWTCAIEAQGEQGIPAIDCEDEDTVVSWVPTATVRITIHYANPAALPTQQRYFIRVTLPNGISNDTVLGL